MFDYKLVRFGIAPVNAPVSQDEVNDLTTPLLPVGFSQL